MNFGTQIFELWVDSEIKVYKDTFKKDISFWMYVKLRYETSIIQLLLTIWKRTAFCLKNYGSVKGSSTCCVRYVPSDLKSTEKYGSLNGTYHSGQFQYRYWHHDIPDTNRTFRSGQGVHFDRHCWNLFIFHHWVGYSLQDASHYGVINIPIEMLRDDSAGRDNARCIRAPHYFQTLGWIGFIYGRMICIGPKFFSVPSPPPPMIWRSRSRTWKFIVKVYGC